MTAVTTQAPLIACEGLVRIYKDLSSKPEHYENAFHCDATWREVPPFGSVLRCVEGPAVGGDTIWVNMAEAYRRLPEVLAHHEGTIRILHRLRPFAVAMAGAGEFDPYKD